MTKGSYELLSLARRRFTDPTLTTTEEVFFRTAEAGEKISGLEGDREKDDPAGANTWKSNRIIRAECLVWLCTDPQASKLVTHLGLRVEGMRFDGVLDARFAKIAFPIRIADSAFTELIGLQGADLPFLSLEGCHLKDILADGIHVRGSLLFRKGFQSTGRIRLAGAKIDGNFELDGARLHYPEGRTLHAEGASVGGCMFLRDGFSSRGEITLLGITVAGSFSCRHAQLLNPGGIALIAERGVFGAGVFLSDGVRCEGEVRFGNATIEGYLDCSESQFLNRNGRAFHADKLRVQDNIFFRDMNADGEVRLVGAHVGGNIECDRARFSGSAGRALVLNGSRVDGNLFLRSFEAVGELDLVATVIGSHLVIEGAKNIAGTSINLTAARAGSLIDDEQSRPRPGKLELDGFCYEHIFQTAPTDADSRIDWLHRQPKERPWPQTYEQLGAVLRSMGDERAAGRVMIAKNRERQRFTHFPRQDWWWYNFFGRIIGYGYRPFRALGLSLAVIILGSVLFATAFSNDLMSPTKETADQKKVSSRVVDGKRHFADDYSVFNPFIYSLEAFTPLLKLDQTANWEPNANHGRSIVFGGWSVTTGQLLRYYLWTHVMLGWVLTSLWVGAITGLVKT